MQKYVTEVPSDWLKEQSDKWDQILSFINDLKGISPQNFITVKEFMERCKISRWTFNELRDNGLITKQIGRKIYIPFSEVNRFFRGELSN